jgi:hypothetical protein
MAFKFRAIFTGLCAYVPNTAGTKLMVVLVNATKKYKDAGGQDALEEGKVALDGQPLEKHWPVLRFPSGALEGGGNLTRAPECLVPLDRERLTFSFTPTPASLQFQQQDTAGKTDRFDWIPSMTEIFDGSGGRPPAHILPAVVGTQPPRESVIAQVFVELGKLSTDTLEPGDQWNRSVVWHYAPNPMGTPERGLANSVALDVDSVDRVTIQAAKLDSVGTREWTFVGKANERVEVRIENVCCDSLFKYLPQDWPSRPDADFRWLYFLLSDQTTLQKWLDIQHYLPIPYPRMLPGGRPIECYGSKFPNESF